MTPLNEIIEKLHLIPLEGEGGMWARVYESDEYVKSSDFPNRKEDRPICNTIYYLITPNSFSSMHKLANDEVWYYHMGSSVELLFVYPDGKSEIKVLGNDIASGEQPQIYSVRGTYVGARMKDKNIEYSLLSTSEAPAYRDSDYTIASYDELRPLLSDDKHEELLKVLTGEIKFI